MPSPSHTVAQVTLSILAAGLLSSACGSPASNGPSSEMLGNGGQTSGGGSGNSANATGTGATGQTTGGAPGVLPAFDAGTDANRNTVAAGEVCERIATIQCAGEQHCCNSPGRTFDQCKSTMKGGCVNNYLDVVTATIQYSGYTSSAAEPIFAKFEQLASQCDVTVTAWGASTDGLRGIVPGTVDASGKCTPSAFELTQPANQQRSAVAAHLASCKTSTQSACLPHPATIPVTEWLCAPLADAGGACFSDINCKDGLYCDNPSLNLAGSTCKQRKSDGSTCAAGNECSSLLCKGGSCGALNQQNAYCLAN